MGAGFVYFDFCSFFSYMFTDCKFLSDCKENMSFTIDNKICKNFFEYF